MGRPEEPQEGFTFWAGRERVLAEDEEPVMCQGYVGPARSFYDDDTVELVMAELSRHHDIIERAVPTAPSFEGELADLLAQARERMAARAREEGDEAVLADIPGDLPLSEFVMRCTCGEHFGVWSPGSLKRHRAEALLNLLGGLGLLRTATAMPCVCDGRYEGCDHANPCGQPDDETQRGPWCASCQPRRLKAITESLDALHATKAQD